jgi:hypothetical protein
VLQRTYVVNATIQSKHVKSELKKAITESVCTLRNIFHALKKDIVDKSARNTELETEFNEVNGELQAYRHTRATTPVVPSIDRLKTPETHTSEPKHPSKK